MALVKKYYSGSQVFDIIRELPDKEFLLMLNAFAKASGADVRENVHAENIAKDYDDCDQFVCSNCGIELQTWVRVERDEDDGDITYHEYVFKFCPNCGADMRERRDDG